MPNDRSDAALRERLELAEKATKGPWIKRSRDFQGEDGFGWESKPTVEAEDKMVCLFYDRDVDADDVDNDEDDAAHIAANSPDVVKADIEEILRLRAENERLNKEANWLAKAIGVQVKDSFGCAWCWLSESDMCNGDYTESLRNAASEAVEEEENV